MKSTECPIGTSLKYSGLTLTKIADATPTGTDPAETIVETWVDEFGQQWTPSLAFQQGTAAQPEFNPING